MKRLLLILAALPAFGQVAGPGTITATVATSGTPVPLSTNNIQAKSFSVQLTTGSATICVGGSNVAEASGKGTCISGTSQNIFYPPLGPGANYDLSKYYVDASSNSTVVTINYNVQQ